MRDRKDAFYLEEEPLMSGLIVLSLHCRDTAQHLIGLDGFLFPMSPTDVLFFYYIEAAEPEHHALVATWESQGNKSAI